MEISIIKSAIRARVAAWRADGDTGAPERLMRADAFQHLRWQIERHKGDVDAAAHAMLDCLP